MSEKRDGLLSKVGSLLFGSPRLAPSPFDRERVRSNREEIEERLRRVKETLEARWLSDD